MYHSITAAPCKASRSKSYCMVWLCKCLDVWYDLQYILCSSIRYDRLRFNDWLKKYFTNWLKKSSASRASWAHRAALISVSCSPQPDTSRSRKTTDTGPVHRVVCPFTPQLSPVLISRPWRDGTLSWRWYTTATGGNRTCDLAIASPAPYHTATA